MHFYSEKEVRNCYCIKFNNICAYRRCRIRCTYTTGFVVAMKLQQTYNQMILSVKHGTIFSSLLELNCPFTSLVQQMPLRCDSFHYQVCSKMFSTQEIQVFRVSDCTLASVQAAKLNKIKAENLINEHDDQALQNDQRGFAHDERGRNCAVQTWVSSSLDALIAISSRK